MNKQIEEMAKDICKLGKPCEKCSAYPDACKAVKYAERFYNAGYRKQSGGEWIKDEKSKFKHRYHCTACDFYLIGAPTKHCPSCGAKMKGDMRE